MTTPSDPTSAWAAHITPDDLGRLIIETVGLLVRLQVRSDREEATSAIIAAVWGRMWRYAPARSDLATFVRVVARSRLRNWLRDRRRRESVIGQFHGEEIPMSWNAPDPDLRNDLVAAIGDASTAVSLAILLSRGHTIKGASRLIDRPVSSCRDFLKRDVRPRLPQY